MATTVCATRSAIVGTPSTRTPAPCGLGISTALTGGGKYEARAHPVPDLVEIVRKIGLECLEILPVHPGCALVGLDPPPRLPDHRLGDRKRLVVGLWHVRSLPPETTVSVVRSDIPDQPAPWLHRHPSKQRLHGYYGPVRQRAPPRYSVPPGAARWQAPSRDLGGLRPRSPHRRSPSHVPCKSRRPGSRRLHAGHRLASHRDTRQAHHRRTARPPAFDATSITLTRIEGVRFSV